MADLPPVHKLRETAVESRKNLRHFDPSWLCWKQRAPMALDELAEIRVRLFPLGRSVVPQE